MGLWAPGDRLPGGSPLTLPSRCLPWPPPRRRRASGPVGSFPSGRLHSCWCGVSKSPVSTPRKPDTEAETTRGGGEKRPGRKGAASRASEPGALQSAPPQEGLGTLRSGTGTGEGGPGAHLAGARATLRAAAAGGAGAQAWGSGEQAAVEGQHLAGDEALQAAAQQQQAVARLHPILVLRAVEARGQFRQHHVPLGPGTVRGTEPGARGGASGSAQARKPGWYRRPGLAPPGVRPHVQGEGRGQSSSRGAVHPGAEPSGLTRTPAPPQC